MAASAPTTAGTSRRPKRAATGTATRATRSRARRGIPNAASSAPTETVETSSACTGSSSMPSWSAPTATYQIQISGHAKDRDEHEFALGAPGSPAWMPHEVDEVRVAVDRALAH